MHGHGNLSMTRFSVNLGSHSAVCSASVFVIALNNTFLYPLLGANARQFPMPSIQLSIFFAQFLALHLHHRQCVLCPLAPPSWLRGVPAGTSVYRRSCGSTTH